MADRFATEIIIGGKVPKKAVKGLVEAIGKESLSLNWGDASFDPQNGKELLEYVEKDGLLHLSDVECAWGDLPDLERFLQDHRIGYDKQVSGRYEYNPELVRYRSGMKEPLIQMTTEDFSPIVEQAEVAKARDLLRSNKPKDSLKLLEELCRPEIPKLPPLEIS